MKNLLLFIAVMAGLWLSGCKKDGNTDELYTWLTEKPWRTDTLQVNGSEPTGLLGERFEKFRGEARFNEDGTGTFGSYNGTWRFPDKTRKQLVINADSLGFPLTTDIVELKANSLKITTSLPDLWGDEGTLNIRITFRPK